MRIDSLIELTRSSLKLGIYAFAAVLLFYLAGYLFLYRKYLFGKKRISPLYFLWLMIMCWYLAVIINVTLAGRGEVYSYRIAPLFSSYREAWYNASVTEWRNIILNYCLFIPLGILLPLGIRFFRKMYRVGAAALILTLSIEIIQVLRKSGIFEFDDILGNVIGALIGYGFFGIALYIYRRKKSVEIPLRRIIGLQIPLFLLIIAYVLLILVYNIKTLGNNSYGFYYGYDPESLTVSSEINLDDKEKTIPLYKAPVLTPDEAVEFACEISDRLGSGGYKKTKDVFDDYVLLRDAPDADGLIRSGSGMTDEQHSSFCLVHYRGGIYENTIFSGAGAGISLEEGNEESRIREILQQYGEEVPDGYDFSIWRKTKYIYEYDFVPYGEKTLYGTMAFRPQFNSYENNVMKCDYAGDYTIISMAEAYNRITEGKFRVRSMDKNLDNIKEYRIKIIGCSLIYELDSKGYLQPDYKFTCTVNDKEKEIIIPALR